MCGNFLIVPYMQLLLNILVFSVQLPKGYKGKNEGRRYQPFECPGSHFSQRKRACSNAGSPLHLHLYDQKQQPAVRAQIPWLPEATRAAPGTHARLLAGGGGGMGEGWRDGGWIAATMLGAETDLNLTTIYHEAFR